MDSRLIDEILESVWTCRENGNNAVKEIVDKAEDPGGAQAGEWMEAMQWMSENEFLRLEGDNVYFTEAGELKAREIIRRHRLGERLFAEIFSLRGASMESGACALEHILNPEVTESVCTLLGHPPTCPHGRPIPRGECCRRFGVEVKPLVQRLSDFEVGQDARIVFMSTKYHDRFDRLSTMGIIPGTVVHLHQKRPSYVIEIDETTLALDKEIADGIFVKKV